MNPTKRSEIAHALHDRAKRWSNLRFCALYDKI
jgi:hypothetical protein